MSEAQGNTPTTVEDDPIQVRKNKRAALIAAGKNPYGHAFDYTAHASDLHARYEHLANAEETNDHVAVAGRIMTKRVQGKLSFLTLRDTTSDIQIFCRINDLGEEEYAQVKDLDLGDWIGVNGTVTRTKRGQLSVIATHIELLSKAIRPLPEKFHGLSNKEMRYRQRYVDLVMNPNVRETFEKRFKIVSAVRRYMEDQQFYEVETPFLHSIMGGANARPFITHHNALNRDFYLRIATELPLKRLLVGGFERVFEIGRQFRNEGMDQYHNPEFTTMEAYQAFSDLEGMKRLTQGFIRAAAMAACGTLSINYQGVDIDLGGTWRDASMIELINEHIDEPISYDMSREELARIAKKNGVVDIEPAWGKGKIISELFEARVEDTLVQPTFVCDHPLEISPLAKKREDNPELTYRFELFICGHEYANAFSELNDPIDQAERFLAQVQAKDMGDDEAMGYDADYIRALEYGMPPAGGVGIGIDRLVMLLTNAESIRDVLLFPTMKPLNDAQVCDVNALDAAESKEQENSAATGCDSAAAAQPASLSNAPHQQADASIDFSNVSIEPLFKDFVDFDTFSKSDFRAVKVKACSAVPKSKKLLQFTLDDGTGCDRTILSGIHAFYEPEQLVGKTCIAITNLPPRTMMGIDSCGMLISAIHEEAGCEKLHLLMVDDHIPAGAKLY